MRARSTTVAAALALAACGSPLDTDGLAPIADYPDWHRVDVTGEVGGHGDTYRIMYVNDTARDWGGAGPYPPGSVVVKEVHELDGDGGPGALSYVAIARKLEAAPDGAALHGGWLWSLAGDRDDVGTDESESESCWTSCHAAAPADGLFHDFGW